MKKLVCFILASMIVFSLTIGVTALTDQKALNAATYCFDNDNNVEDWQLFGSYEEAGVRLIIDEIVKEAGAGSLAVLQNISRAVTENKFGGFFITAEQLELESFAGCTMQISYTFHGDNANAIDNFSLFSDGVVWIQNNIQPDSSTSGRRAGWGTAALTVPASAGNDRFGFTIPTFSATSGISVYIDNVIITDGEGNAIANMGDYQPHSDETQRKMVHIGINIALYAVIGIVAVLIIGCIIYFVRKAISKGQY